MSWPIISNKTLSQGRAYMTRAALAEAVIPEGGRRTVSGAEAQGPGAYAPPWRGGSDCGGRGAGPWTRASVCGSPACTQMVPKPR